MCICILTECTILLLYVILLTADTVAVVLSATFFSCILDLSSTLYALHNLSCILCGIWVLQNSTVFILKCTLNRLKGYAGFLRITIMNYWQSFMVALWNRADHIYFHAVVCSSLWSPYVIGQTIILLSCDFYLSFFFFLFFFPRLILAAVDWMPTILPHMVWP